MCLSETVPIRSQSWSRDREIAASFLRLMKRESTTLNNSTGKDNKERGYNNTQKVNVAVSSLLQVRIAKREATITCKDVAAVSNIVRELNLLVM